MLASQDPMQDVCILGPLGYPVTGNRLVYPDRGHWKRKEAREVRSACESKLK